MFTIWQCDFQHLLTSATNMKEVHLMKSPSLKATVTTKGA